MSEPNPSHLRGVGQGGAGEGRRGDQRRREEQDSSSIVVLSMVLVAKPLPCS